MEGRQGPGLIEYFIFRFLKVTVVFVCVVCVCHLALDSTRCLVYDKEVIRADVPKLVFQ